MGRVGEDPDQPPQNKDLERVEKYALVRYPDPMEIKLPKRFYADHRARDCGQSGKVVHSTKNFVTVELDDVAFEDLKSDADYYASFDGEDFHINRGVCLSARATLKALAQYERGSK